MSMKCLPVVLSAIAVLVFAAPNGLPDPVDKLPTPKPTVSPNTIFPTTYEATINGQTRSPSVHPTNIPSIMASVTTTMSSSQNGNGDNMRDRNHNGKDDILEFYSLPAIPIQGICSLITWILFIPLMYHMFVKKTDKKIQIPLTIKLPVILTFLCNNIGILCIMIVSIMIATAKKWDQHMYDIALIPYYTASVTYALGKFCLEMFFIFRVFHAFNQSAFKLSHWIMILLFIWTVIISVAWFMMFYVVTVDQNLSFKVPYYGYLILSMFELLFVVTLLYMFTKRLTKLILLHKLNLKVSSQNAMHSAQNTPESVASTISAISKEVVDINKEEDEYSLSVKVVQAKLSSHQTRMIFLITRCILTSSFAIITTILFGIVLFYFEEFGIHIFIVYALWALDLTINCICLYLNFAFSTKIYNVCCKICHVACQNMLEYCAAKQILKQEYNQSL